jgi:hypothetical protein
LREPDLVAPDGRNERIGVSLEQGACRKFQVSACKGPGVSLTTLATYTTAGIGMDLLSSLQNLKLGGT